MEKVLTAFVISFIIPVISVDTEYDGPLTVKLFHNLEDDNDPQWLPCGVITMENINAGSLSVIQHPLDVVGLNKIKDLARHDSLYRLKAVAITSKGNELQFHSFCKACALVENNLVNTLTMVLDQSGSVVGFTQATSGKCLGYTDNELKASGFNTTLELKTIEQGPIPDTATYIQKIEREREAKERGVGQDNRSFFAKYWIYIVPIVIFAMLSGSSMDAGANPR